MTEANGDTQDARYAHVFEPLRIGPVDVPNRIYLSPHGIPLQAPVPGHESHSMPSEDHAYYFAERAAGGVGLIFQSTQVGVFAAQVNQSASPELPESIPAYRRIADRVHEHGAKVMAEVWYVPWLPKRWDALGPDAPSLAPSATQHFAFPGTRYAMRKHDFAHVLDVHRTSARHLREADYDGVELHVSHGSLLEYFISPYHNRRTDEYGGSIENRARLLRECLEVTREEIGDGMALGMRLTADQMMEGGADADHMRALLEHLHPLGLLDFVDLDVSLEPEQAHLMTTSYFMKKLHNVERAEYVGQSSGPLVVITTPGRLTSLADAERILANGKLDMVGAVRGLIADPDLVRNAREGRESESRICIAINQCTGTTPNNFGCAINPAAGREERWGRHAWRDAPKSMRIVVVGGGPAGLEAARVAARRGHDVVVFEKEDRVGGGLALWADLPGREHLKTLPHWFEARLAAAKVDLRLGVETDVDMVLAESPDVVFVATGSVYARDGESGFAPRPIPGWEQDFVFGPEPVLRGETTLAGTVVVLDDEGFHTAVGCAEVIAADGATVHLVTRKLSIADATAREGMYIAPRLRAVGVVTSTLTYVQAIGERTVRLKDLSTGEERTLDVDAVVLATMRRPVDELADALEGKVPYVYLIGDALSPRSLREATYEGHRFARVVGEDDMPRHVTDELFKPLNTLQPAGLR